MKRLAVFFLLLVGVAHAASLPCTIIIDANGTASAMCTGSAPTPTPPPVPTPAPTPKPSPAPGTCAAPSNAVMQTMYLAGTNNYVFDDRTYRNPPPGNPSPTPAATSPQGTIQIFPLKTAWPDGDPVYIASVQFASFIVYNLGGQYEVSFSRCPGDFETYKHDTPTQGTFPCGALSGPDFALAYIIGVPSGITYCGIPAGEQWYMNWRSIDCPADKGKTCGQTFYVPRG